MAFQFSKLQNESLEKFCSPYCDIQNNPSRICPPECTSYCNPNCLFPYPQLPPIDVPEASHDYNPADHHQKIPLFLAIYLSIILTTLFLCFTSMYCKSWNSSRREASGPQPQTDDHNHVILDQVHDPEVDHPIWHIRSVGLESSVISSINTCKFKKGSDVVEGTECAVCLSEFGEDETLRLLPNCKHAFHTPCIDKWLKSHTSCPICRADIVINPVGMPSSAQHADSSC